MSGLEHLDQVFSPELLLLWGVWLEDPLLDLRLQPNDVVTIEIKPSTGSILKVERMLPQAIDYVMDLA